MNPTKLNARPFPFLPAQLSGTPYHCSPKIRTLSAGGASAAAPLLKQATARSAPARKQRPHPGDLLRQDTDF